MFCGINLLRTFNYTSRAFDLRIYLRKGYFFQEYFLLPITKADVRTKFSDNSFRRTPLQLFLQYSGLQWTIQANKDECSDVPYHHEVERLSGGNRESLKINSHHYFSSKLLMKQWNLSRNNLYVPRSRACFVE